MNIQIARIFYNQVKTDLPAHTAESVEGKLIHKAVGACCERIHYEYVQIVISPVRYQADFFNPDYPYTETTILHSFYLERRNPESSTEQASIDCLQQETRDFDKLMLVMKNIQPGLEMSGINIVELSEKSKQNKRYYGNTYENGFVETVEDIMRHAKAYAKTLITLDEILRK